MSAIYIPGFIEENRSETMFRDLWDNLTWERRADAPRREYWTNVWDRDYTYGSGAGVRTYEARPATPPLSRLVRSSLMTSA